jgi:hypothetical protein
MSPPYEIHGSGNYVGGAPSPASFSADKGARPATFGNSYCRSIKKHGECYFCLFSRANLAILSTNSGKSMPRALAAMGTRLREVMPGRVLISRQ